MSIGLLFWILMIIGLFFGGWLNYPFNTNGRGFGGFLVLWVLLALLGWQVFGPALKH